MEEGLRKICWHVICKIVIVCLEKTGMEINRIRISLKTVTNEEQKPVETVVLLLEQVAFIMFIF
jgi:hypothetical protein